MLLNIQRRDGSTELRHYEIGSNVVGMRFTSVVIENSKEAHALLLEKGQDWWERKIVPNFVKPKI